MTLDRNREMIERKDAGSSINNARPSTRLTVINLRLFSFASAVCLCCEYHNNLPELWKERRVLWHSTEIEKWLKIYTGSIIKLPIIDTTDPVPYLRLFSFVYVVCVCEPVTSGLFTLQESLVQQTNLWITSLDVVSTVPIPCIISVFFLEDIDCLE